MIYYDNLEFEKEIQFEVYILNKYLSRKYSKETAIALISKNKKDLDILAKPLGRSDIAFFCEYFLREMFVPSDENIAKSLSDSHYEVFEELNKLLIYDSYNNEEFILPRGWAKSTIINTAVATWASCYAISKYTVVIGKTDKLMEEFIFEVKSCLGYKKVIENFGTLVNSKKRTVNKEELELDNDTKIQGFTWGGTIRGAKYQGVRPSIIITDDVLKEDDILSENAKEKCVNKYYKEVLPAGDKARVIKGVKQGLDTKFIVIGTPLASDDFVNTIKNDSSFIVYHRGVCDFNVDDYFSTNKYWKRYKSILMNNRNPNRIKNAENYYYNHEKNMKFKTIWEGKYKCFELANDYFTKRLSFMQELMCDCESVGDIWIKYMAKLKAEEIENRKFESTILTIDQGASNTSKADFTSITVLGKSNGFYLVREGSLYKFDSKTEFDKYIDTVVLTLKKWTDITHVFLEKNVYKGVDATRIEEAIRADKELCSRKIVVETTYATKNKDQRIMTITDKINSGQIIFNDSNTDYNKQVFEFRGQKFTLHDDAIDSLEMAVNNIDKVKPLLTKLKIYDISKLYKGR